MRSLFSPPTMMPRKFEEEEDPQWGKNVKVQGRDAYRPRVPLVVRVLARLSGYWSLSVAVVAMSVILLAGAAAIFGWFFGLTASPPLELVSVCRSGFLSEVKEAMGRVDGVKYEKTADRSDGREAHVWSCPDWKGEWSLVCRPWSEGGEQIHQPRVFYEDFTGRFEVEVLGNTEGFDLKWTRLGE